MVVVRTSKRSRHFAINCRPHIRTRHSLKAVMGGRCIGLERLYAPKRGICSNACKTLVKLTKVS
jgi:hypothetical protein